MVQRLWEINHPYYAAEGEPVEYDTFDQLRSAIDALDEDMNFVYRWDWMEDADYPDVTPCLLVTTVMQRKSRFVSYSCPIRHDQEADVLEWLHSDRVAGHLRKTWAPILDVTDTGGALDLSNLRSDVDYWRGRALAAERHVDRLEGRA